MQMTRSIAFALLLAVLVPLMLVASGVRRAGFPGAPCAVDYT